MEGQTFRKGFVHVCICARKKNVFMLPVLQITNLRYKLITMPITWQQILFDFFYWFASWPELSFKSGVGGRESGKAEGTKVARKTF